MKHKISILIASLLFINVCFAQAYGDRPSRSLSITIGAIFMVLVLFTIAGIPFLWFRNINKKFKETYAQYDKKYLWSLLYFPCFYVVTLIALALANIAQIIETKASIVYGTLLVSVFLLVAAILLRKRINTYLFNWNYESVKPLKLTMGTLVCLLPLYYILCPLILDSYRYFLGFSDESNTVSLIMYLLLGGAVWYFSQRKIDQLDLVLPSNHNQSANTAKPKTHKGASAADKILELKRLHDQGILTDEEFTRLKGEIITNSDSL